MEKGRLTVLILLVVAITMIPSAGLGGAAYYVDAIVGADGNSGTQGSPWRSVARVNRAPLKPGDAVYFRSGQRWDAVLQPVSGVKGRPVIYGGYGTGSRPSIGGAAVKGGRFVQLRDLELRSMTEHYPLLIEKSEQIAVTRCDIIAESGSKAYAALYLTRSHHNTISACRVERRDLKSQGDAIYLYVDANHNLIEGNEIGIATHYSLFLEGSTAGYPQSTADHNVIRKNRIWNPEGAQLSIVSNASHNLIEENEIRGGKSTPFNAEAASSFQLLTRNNVVRKNIIHDNSSPAGYGLQMIAYRYQDAPANQILGNHIYNNVITDIYRYPVVIGNYEPRLCEVKNNRLANNIVCASGSSPTHEVVVERVDGVAGNSFRNNLVCGTRTSRNVMIRGTSYSLRDSELKHLGDWIDNIGSDPGLDRGFRPIPGSPAIDAGAFLTRVTSPTGSGSSLKLEDAGWFSDGFGISAGDTIVVGASTAVIATIDYPSNLVILDRPIAWRHGDRVSLPYRGAAPDIGAFEFTVVTPSPPRPSP